MIRGARVLASLLVVAGLVGCAGGPPDGQSNPRLTLFVAASLTDAIQEVGDAYGETRPVEMAYNFAGSGALAQQLLAAPRADVFLSASERWMDAVEEGGRVVAGTRRTLLSNSLVVIANPGFPIPEDTRSLLCAPRFRHLAIGDPEAVPAGRYAREWLRSVPCPGGGSAWEALADRVSPAPDVRAAVAQAESSAEVVGIVYRTDWMARRQDVQLVHEIGAEEGPTIRYPVALIRDTRSSPVAADFLDFLEGDRARAVFERHGFRVVPAARELPSPPRRR